MMRDWKTTLLPASYNGMAFWVDGEDRSGGRRLAIHETNGGETTIIEDMGAGTREISVTAYLAGDLADFQANALIAACDQAGPGLLVLPIDGMILAWPNDYRRSRSKDRHGHIAVDLGFVLEGPTMGATLSLGNIGAVFAGGVVLAASAFSRMF